MGSIQGRRKSTHECWGVGHNNRCFQSIRRVAIEVIPELLERRQPPQKAQRRVRSEHRRRAVRRHMEHVFLAAHPQRPDRLLRDAYNLLAFRYGEDEARELHRVLHPRAVRLCAPDDEPLHPVGLDVGQRARDGAAEVRR